jgi:hypothetical protein
MDRFTFPLIFLRFFKLEGVVNPLNAALYFSNAPFYSNFKKFSRTNSALSSGISVSLFKNISRIICLFQRCLSSYLLNCPFLAIGGIGKPGCKIYKFFLSHSKSEYLLSTLALSDGVKTIYETYDC